MNFIENESPRKLRGGYYTDPQIANYLTRWVLEVKPKQILEPSCGSGVFIKALTELDSAFVEAFVGIEIEEAEAKQASDVARGLRGIRAQILTGDFLGWALSRTHQPPEFEGALGNPPFIRYQYLPEAQQNKAAKLFEHFGLRFTKHTNAWVPFVLASLANLRPGGRLAMVVPSELLHVLHAESLRQYLLAECSRLLVIDPTQLWFGETLQGVVLLLAEKKAEKASPLGTLAITPVHDRGFLDKPPETLFNSADFTQGNGAHGKWMHGLLTQRERLLLEDISASTRVARLRDLADVDVGIVTGANKFFLVPDAIVDQYSLHRWAHPMFGRSEHVPGVIYDAAVHARNKRLGLPTNFLWFRDTALSDLNRLARMYIAKGEAEQLPSRYKCRIREPWYTVPSVYSVAVGMLKRCHDFPRLILNKIAAFTTDTAYRLKPKKANPNALVFSFVNSLTALSAELEGRHYGGGVLELVPSEIEQLLIPIGTKGRVPLRTLDRRFVAGDHAEAILEAQDAVVLVESGIPATAAEELRAAWHRLRTRRHRTPVDEA